MTVGELSNKFGKKEEKVFELLGITPTPEDYKLSIMKLRKKYNKTPDEMLKGLKSIIDYNYTYKISTFGVRCFSECNRWNNKI